jgi:hypothetical protein
MQYLGSYICLRIILKLQKPARQMGTPIRIQNRKIENIKRKRKEA